MVSPLLLLKFLPNAWQVLAAVETYGYPRLYRRVAEATRHKTLRLTATQQTTIRGAVKESLRFPVRTYSLLYNHEMVAFGVKWAEEIMKDKQVSALLPPVLVSAASYIIKNTKLGKYQSLIEKLEKEAQKKRRDR